MIALNFVIKALPEKLSLPIEKENTIDTLKKNSELFIIALLLFTHSGFSQKTDSTKSISYFSGAVSVTNNGISIVPTFSLEKPAAIFNLSIAKKQV